jgi:hypothetical protein
VIGFIEAEESITIAGGAVKKSIFKDKMIFYIPDTSLPRGKS